VNAVEFDPVKLVPVYIFRGNDAYLKDGVINKLRDVISADEWGVGFLRFEEDSDVSDVVAAADTFSFFGDKKVIFYAPQKNFKLSESDKTALAEYCKNPCETTVLFIEDSGGNFKFLDRYAEIIQCSNPGDVFIGRWLKNLFMLKGTEIKSDAADALIKYCGSDMMRISVEVEKLMSYTENTAVTLKDVADCVTPDTETQVFELTDCLSKKDNKRSVIIYNILMARGEAPAFLLSIITTQFRRIMHVMLSDLNDGELASLFGIKEYPIVLARRLSGNFTKLKVKKIVDNLTLNEYLFKSGAISERAALDLSFSYLLTV
jgi:DNA polymerase-3 subunit delta